ncbi:hypothetical protein [Enterococcus sp. AZ126]|uniref:hypothetical protein n=1 Tax=Enterococcus sp. AZ126 TaxID=2774635 RepID=UPI003F6876F9
MSVADQQVISQQQAFTNELAEIWATDWLVTRAESSYFELTYGVCDPATAEPIEIIE